MDLEVHVASISGKYPGIHIAKNFHEIDITSPEKVLNLSKKLEIDGILSTANDISLSSIGLVVDSMNLRGFSANTGTICQNKLLMKRKLSEYSLRTAKFKLVSSALEVSKFFEKTDSNCVIKPVDSSGSRGVIQITKDSNLYKDFEIAKNNSKIGKVIVEEWIEGTEFGAQAIIVGRKLERLILHSDITTEPPIRIPIGHGCPHPKERDLQKECEKMVRMCIDCLDLKDSICNIDFIDTPEGPYIVEITPRMGGTRLPEVCGEYIGVNMYEMAVKIALGMEIVTTSNGTGTPNAACNVLSWKSGLISSFINTRDSNFFVQEAVIDENVRVNSNGYCELGYVHVKENENPELLSIAKNLAANIEQCYVISGDE